MANVKNYGVSVRDKLKKLISDGTTYQQISYPLYARKAAIQAF